MGATTLFSMSKIRTNLAVHVKSLVKRRYLKYHIKTISLSLETEAYHIIIVTQKMLMVPK